MTADIDGRPMLFRPEIDPVDFRDLAARFEQALLEHREVAGGHLAIRSRYLRAWMDMAEYLDSSPDRSRDGYIYDPTRKRIILPSEGVRFP